MTTGSSSSFLPALYRVLLVIACCTAVSTTAPAGTANRLHPELLPTDCGRPPPRASSNRTNFLDTEPVAVAADQLPYQTHLLRRDKTGHLEHTCSGVLITRRHVVTAAHCVVHVALNDLVVRVADLRADRADPHEQTLIVEDMEIHREFFGNNNFRAWQHDVALLRLNTAVRLSQQVQPVCLPAADAVFLPPGVGCRTSGWSDGEKPVAADTPLATRPLRLVSNSFCSAPEVYPHRFNAATMLCSMPEPSGSSATGSSCRGDGGAPLVCGSGSNSRVLVGISSQVDALRCSFHPQLNVRVTSFVDWLLRQLRCEQNVQMGIGGAAGVRPAVASGATTISQASQQKPVRQLQHQDVIPSPAVAPQWPGCGKINSALPLKSVSAQFVDGAHTFPWTAAVYERLSPSGRGSVQLEFRCGGAVLTNRWILTAAHCVPEPKKHYYVVRVGEMGWTDAENGLSSEAQLSIVRVVLRPDYDRSRYETSIALLRTRSRIPFSIRVGAVCLPSMTAPPPLAPSGRRLLIAGFGAPRPRQAKPVASSSQPETASIRLKWAQLQLVNRQDCVHRYVTSGSMTVDNFGNNTFCTSAAVTSEGGRRSEFQCAVNLRDKGSLVVDAMKRIDGKGISWRAVGMFFDRWLYDCGPDDYPHIHIALAPYADWIRRITGIQ